MTAEEIPLAVRHQWMHDPLYHAAVFTIGQWLASFPMSYEVRAITKPVAGSQWRNP